MAKFIVLSFVFVCILSCQDSSKGTSETPQTQKSLVHYGFALIDCGWDDPQDNLQKTNYVDEVSGFTNIGQLCVYSADDVIDQRLNRFNSAGIKAILHIEALLFERKSDANIPSGEKVSLSPNAVEQWNQFFNLNQDILSSDKVAAIYVIDEPIWNGVSQSDFQKALQLVKDKLPDIPTLSIEAYPVLDQMVVPNELDWVGFDRYDSADPANDPNWLDDLDTVKNARSRSDQRLVIVASTQWLPYYESDGGILPQDVSPISRSYYEIAKSTPESIALIGYVWPGGLDDNQQLGARNLPDSVRQTLREIGTEIISGQ